MHNFPDSYVFSTCIHSQVWCYHRIYECMCYFLFFCLVSFHYFAFIAAILVAFVILLSAALLYTLGCWIYKKRSLTSTAQLLSNVSKEIKKVINLINYSSIVVWTWFSGATWVVGCIKFLSFFKKDMAQ